MTNSLIFSIKQQIQSWFSQAKAKAKEKENGLLEIPDTIKAQLGELIEPLSSPIVYQKTVQKEVATKMKAWQENLDAPNTIVFLGSAVEPIVKIMQDSLQNWQNPPLKIITPLKCLTRPADPLTMKMQIKQALKPYQQVDQPGSTEYDRFDAESLEERTTAILIPSLDQCFLRCIGGWESIEYFRDLAINNRNCFWIVGASHWAWEFLDLVCQVSAYFNSIKALPQLDGAMLQEWLEPTINKIVKDDFNRKDYFDSLAKESSGISSIAVHLWLQSLRIPKDNDLDEENLPQINLKETTASNQPLVFYQINPSLPSLPPLTARDRYLLNCVLIHGQINRNHLALSLGESKSLLESEIQLLLQKGILKQRKEFLFVYAPHYAKLKSELANNNFLVSEN